MRVLHSFFPAFIFAPVSHDYWSYLENPSKSRDHFQIISIMKKGIKNHPADIKNPNKGTNGTNIIWDKTNGNKGKQLNPNQVKPAPKKNN